MAAIHRFSHILNQRYKSGTDFTFPDNEPHRYENMNWISSSEKPTKEQFIIWMNEKNAENALDEVRVERNKKLVETDWTQGADVPVGIKTTYQVYRQALRDFPSDTSKWTMDDNGILSITWPTKPS